MVDSNYLGFFPVFFSFFKTFFFCTKGNISFQIINLIIHMKGLGSICLEKCENNIKKRSSHLERVSLGTSAILTMYPLILAKRIMLYGGFGD